MSSIDTSTAMFTTVICALTAIVAALHVVAAKRHTSVTADKPPSPITDDIHRTLRKRYLIVYSLACFADWLQGPYTYDLYREYELDGGEIAVLFIVSTVSNNLFGTVTGALADLYGRRVLCVAYGVLYAACCVTKLSANYGVLTVGCVLGGMSSSILYSAFDSWYTNEHVSHHKLPNEWLSETFAKATFIYAALAILAGLFAHLLVGVFQLGPVAPFVVAVPFLVATSAFAAVYLREHYTPDGDASAVTSIKRAVLLSVTDRRVFSLNVVQSLYDGVVYLFTYVWTPALDALKPPLGLLFASFMLALMAGSQVYTIMVDVDANGSNRTLQLSTFLAFISFAACALAIYIVNYAPYATISCYFFFLVYEVSIGVYIPSMTYLKSQIIPEDIRVTTSNVMKFPKHVFICSALIGIRLHGQSHNDSAAIISTIYAVCVVATAVTFVFAVIFSAFRDDAATAVAESEHLPGAVQI